MALLHADGFDHYAVGGTGLVQLQSWYTVFDVDPIASVAGMTGANCCLTRGNSYFSYNFSSGSNFYAAGWRVILTGLPTSNTWFGFMQGFYASRVGYSVGFTAAGAIQLKRGIYDGTLVATSARDHIVQPNQAFYLEIGITRGAGPFTTQVTVRINNQVELIVSGLTTDAYYDGAWCGATNIPKFYFDDFYLVDGSGTKNNNFLGDRQAILTAQTSDIGGGTWLTTGGSGFAILATVPPNDTQYIYTATVGAISEFGHAPLPAATVDIAAMVIFSRVSKSDAGVASLGVGPNSNGTTNLGTVITPGTGFGWAKGIYELDPDGNVDWTRLKYNASNIRFERLS